MPDQPISDAAARDYASLFNPPFELDRRSVALVVVDMQYASASRRDGLGALLKAKGLEDRGAYRFDRIEQVVTPTIQSLLVAFRRDKLPVVYLTVGSKLPDFGDMLPGMRRFAEAIGNTEGAKEHRILDELAPLAREAVVNKNDHERLPLLRFRALHPGDGAHAALLHWCIDQLLRRRHSARRRRPWLPMRDRRGRLRRGIERAAQRYLPQLRSTARPCGDGTRGLERALRRLTEGRAVQLMPQQDDLDPQPCFRLERQYSNVED